MANWKFKELNAGEWALTPNSGWVALSLTTNAINNNKYYFFVDHNPTNVSEDNQALIKRFDTINNESVRIETYRPGDIHGLTKYSIKLEFQSQSTYNRIKYLFNNAKAFALYNDDDTVIESVRSYSLVIDDISIDWTAIRGKNQIYGLTLKCTDISTDANANPIRWKFREISERRWNNGIIGTPGSRSIITDYSPSGLSEGYKRKGSEVETINGKTVRIYPVRINPDTKKVEKIPPTKTLNVKLEYQSRNTYLGLVNLYSNYEWFYLFGNTTDEDRTINNSEFYGKMTIDDLNIEYSSTRGLERYYGISLQLKEVDR